MKISVEEKMKEAEQMSLHHPDIFYMVMDKIGKRAIVAVGLTADIKLGTRSSYEVIKIDGEERFIEWDIEEGGAYQEVPKWLFPVRAAVDFLDMDAGDGRNQALFNYILTLTSNDFSVDDTRVTVETLVNTGGYGCLRLKVHSLIISIL